MIVPFIRGLLLHNLQDRLNFFCELWQETRKGCQTPDQSLDLLQILGTSHLSNSGAFVWVGLNGSGGQHEPQKFSDRHSENTLLRVETHVALAHLVEDFFEVANVFFGCLRLYNHVVHIYLHGPTDLPSKDPIHKPLIGSPCILQTERHDFIAKVRSRKLRKLCPEAPSTSRSMLGRGYASFGHALLRSVKSVHILHFPLAFFTITTFASHVVYLISFMKSAPSSFFTSSSTAFLRSSPIFLFFWATGRYSLKIANLWDITSG